MLLDTFIIIIIHHKITSIFFYFVLITQVFHQFLVKLMLGMVVEGQHKHLLKYRNLRKLILVK